MHITCLTCKVAKHIVYHGIQSGKKFRVPPEKGMEVDRFPSALEKSNKYNRSFIYASEDGLVETAINVLHSRDRWQIPSYGFINIRLHIL